ncbi:MAG TPA: phospholipase D-like domain-containing protein [Candidatus Gastranaerophilaceae bacterium]|nr:phospholipase D-like domain-containing protein [Candidatus Gastranaerophilaceae bacterium]HPT41125.1 phospholipase D-like domain-containing protein [Candidatus Gastranaerophilaceae bacterium]
MKGFTVTILIFSFLVFLAYQFQKTAEFDVLEITSPIEFTVDLNNNGIKDDDEEIFLEDIKSFSTKPSQSQTELAKKIGISQEDALGLGFLAQNFAKENLSKKVKFTGKEDKKILIDNKVYEKMLLEQGFATSKSYANKDKIQQNILKAKKLNLRIFNNKSLKYHKLNCKYGLLAHNSQILPLNQIPKDAKACQFCSGKQKEKNKSKKIITIYEEKIPYAPKAAGIFNGRGIEIYLPDLTSVLKPSNKCNTDFCRALLREINCAQSSIYFAIYGYTKTPAIQSALENAQKRGVKVRFVYDIDGKNQNLYPDTLYLTSVFKNNNADFAVEKKYQNIIMHNKFFIFDNKKVLTGSANISDTDLSGFNSNAIIILDSQQAANVYSQEFEQMYGGKFHNTKQKICNKEGLQVGDTEFSVYFSPTDRTMNSKIIPLIDSAQKYIYMPVFLITHQGLCDSLIRAKNRGVDVKVIIDATNAHGTYSGHKLLRQAGIKVKTENYAGKIHSKSIIIDDLYTIIGSMNFSRSGDNKNDENVLVIKNPDIAVFYKKFFQYLWLRIDDKWLYKNARAESPDSIGSCTDGVDNDFDKKIDMQDESCRAY